MYYWNNGSLFQDKHRALELRIQRIGKSCTHQLGTCKGFAMSREAGDSSFRKSDFLYAVFLTGIEPAQNHLRHIAVFRLIEVDYGMLLIRGDVAQRSQRMFVRRYQAIKLTLHH